jgi:hypothetical protein
MGGEDDARHADLGKLGKDSGLVLTRKTDPTARILMQNRRKRAVRKFHTP